MMNSMGNHGSVDSPRKPTDNTSGTTGYRTAWFPRNIRAVQACYQRLGQYLLCVVYDALRDATQLLPPPW